MEENQTEPPRGGHHEKERKGEAGFAGASDRGTGFEHDLELCRAGQPQPHGASNGEKRTLAHTSGHNARGRHGRGKNPDCSEPCVSAECRSEIQSDARSTASGEDDCSCKSRETVEGKRRDYLSPLAYSVPAHAGYDSRDQKGWRENSYSKRDNRPCGRHYP